MTRLNANRSVGHCLASIASEDGGPARTVTSIVRSLSKIDDIDVRLFANVCSDDMKPMAGGVPIVTIPSRTMKGFRNELLQLQIQSPLSILHDHGQWLWTNRAAASFSRKTRIKRVVSPRGMLSPWSLNHKKWKKRIAWGLFAKRDLFTASLIHATSDLEASELRMLGCKLPIAVIPNGVDDPFEYTTPTKKNSSRKAKTLLFLSRIHEKKGIFDLLRCWERLNVADWELVLAGPDEQGILKRTTLPPRTRYIGTIDGPPKFHLFREADLFVLPSYSENFGVVIAESLISGTPVLTTTATPWEDVERQNCGWWISPGSDALEAKLKTVLETPTETLIQMGENGRIFAKRSFSWNSIADNMAKVYRWLVDDTQPMPTTLAK